MSLLDILRSGVKTIDKVVKVLEATVQYERYLRSDGFGNEVYAPVVEMRAIVDWKQAQVRTNAGILSVSRAVISFLDIDAMVAATNGEGISDEDRITLPDGTTGPILDMAGFIDAGTGHPVATDVFLG